MLNNRSIMLNFNLTETIKNDSLPVFLDTKRKLVNGSATLQALEELMSYKNLSRESMGYYFSGYQIFENATYHSDDLHTNNTFCTTDPTAAVFMTLPQPGFHLTAYKMTLFMLGSTHTPNPTDDDYKKLNETFQMCLKKEDTEPTAAGN
ncbi:uncharacterized protein [Dermacentor andersoni]|nr:uncharacterized protein LOC129380251 isoform X2 [Dermacentor andersoni]